MLGLSILAVLAFREPDPPPLTGCATLAWPASGRRLTNKGIQMNKLAHLPSLASARSALLPLYRRRKPVRSETIVDDRDPLGALDHRSAGKRQRRRRASRSKARRRKTLDDVLRREPSVDLPLASSYQVHPTALNVSMRGLGGIRALVLLDGVPLNDPFFGYIQWSQVPLETVDRVEIVRGGGATLWGNYAMGGVINILTRPIDRTELIAEAAAGSYGTYRADGHAASAGSGFGIGLDAGINHTTVTSSRSRRIAGRSPSQPRSPRTPSPYLRMRTSRRRSTPARGSATSTTTRTCSLTLQRNRQRTWRYTGSLTQRLGAQGFARLDAVPRQQPVRDVQHRHAGRRRPTVGGVRRERPSHARKGLGASLVWRQGFSGMLRELSAGLDYHGIRAPTSRLIFDETGTQIRTDIGSGRQRSSGASFKRTSGRRAVSMRCSALRYQDFYNYNGVDLTPGGLGTNVPNRHDTDLDPRLSFGTMWAAASL